MILIIATLLIGLALWLAASSAYKLSRSPDRVQEQVATVTPDELVDAQANVNSDAQPQQPVAPSASPEQRAFYRDFVGRYYQLFRARFEPFRQAEDKQLSRDEFDDAFIRSEQRLENVASGKLDFATDSRDLRDLLNVMTKAAENSVTNERLQKYRTAKKVLVQSKVQRTRTEYRRGWDSYSSNCPDWYQSPIGCPVQRAVKVPYTETVSAMEFPKGTQSHLDLFRAFQDRYFQLLAERRDQNTANANSERENIINGKLEGSASLLLALQIFGGFLALMFFFLLIAIERHQRRLSAKVPSE